MKYARPIYYQYLELLKKNKIYHLVNLDNEGYSFLLPHSYQIKYSESYNCYENNGHICFQRENKNFYLEFTKKTYNNFKFDIEKNSKYILKSFTNYQNKDFVELKIDKIDYIYMYFDEYEYKVYSNFKFSLNEYFEIYFILFSLSFEKVFKDINLLSQLIYFSENSIELYYNDVDILQLDLTMHSEDCDISGDTILIKDDLAFLEYKKLHSEVENTNFWKPFNIKIENNVCYFEGKFDFYSLGIYYQGMIQNYDEIIFSEELNDSEKKELIKTLLEQKQIEIKMDSHILENVVLNECFNFIKENIDYDKWSQYHLMEFIGFEHNFDDKNNYVKFVENINDYDTFIKSINKENILKSVQGVYITIYSEHYELKFNCLNNFIYHRKVVINEDFSILT